MCSSGADKLFDRKLLPTPESLRLDAIRAAISNYTVLSWTHAINALRSVLVFGTGIKAAAYDVVLIIIPTIVLFIFRVVALSRTRLSRKNN